MDELEGMKILREHAVDTPYGPPSHPIQEGRMGRATLFFLQRHGSSRAIPPHRINYRANLWAMQALGASAVVAINAVGGITEAMKPGRLLIPDQVVDYTWGREHTFDEGENGALMHIDFTEPYDRDLRMALVIAANAANIPHEPSGVLAVTQGPRLETAAEIQRLARDGCDVVGMTGMPEASLAKELGIPFACVCMVVNAAAGLGSVPLTLETMKEILAREAGVVRYLLAEFLRQRA
jgi:5'-methylthioinosine phosphorylase